MTRCCCRKCRVVDVGVCNLDVDGRKPKSGQAVRALTQTRSQQAGHAAMGTIGVPKVRESGQLCSREGSSRGMARTVLVQLRQILTSSSYTSSTHRKLGASRSLICGFTSRSNATSGTNKVGRGPVELPMAVRISVHWFDAREGMAKNVIEDVIDPRAASQSFS
jgi:hypothetical protein